MLRVIEASIADKLSEAVNIIPHFCFFTGESPETDLPRLKGYFYEFNF